MAKGKKLGRLQPELPKEFIKEYKKFKDDEYDKMSGVHLQRLLGIGRSTLYKYINIYEEQ